MSAGLRVYLEQLRTRPGELVDVRRQVSQLGESCAVVKALEPAGKPAVWFHDIADSDLPVVMGVFGTRERLAASVGVGKRDLVSHALTTMAGPLPHPVDVQSAPIDEVVALGDDIDLSRLPIGVHSREDAGRYITSGVTVASDPRSGAINTGMYRIMVTGKRTLTVNAAPDHDLGRVFAAASAEGRDVPVAIVIGHHPGYYIASQLKNPVGQDTHHLAGALMSGPLAVTAGRTIDLEVPAEAEIVLEGIVRPADKVSEGPFGEFSYYYGSAQAPVCEITAIRRRSDAVFLDLHPTHDEHRCLWLFPGREARLLEAVRRSVPGVGSVRIPFYGGALSAYIAVRKSREGDGKQAMLAAIASDHFLKHVVVVDDDVDIFDDLEVLWATNVRSQASQDLTVLPGFKGIRMDPSARAAGATGDRVTDKVLLDATRPLVPQFPPRADVAVSGYEEIDVATYLEPSERQRIADAGHWRARMEE